LTGSIDLDATLSSNADHRHAPRWDYGLGYRVRPQRERAIWIEVHPASTSEVQAVLRKLDWLRVFLRDEAPELGALTAEPINEIEPFVWLATASGTHITPNSPQARQLNQAGLSLPRRMLRLR